MRVLTVKQPWAQIIVAGSKNIENRDWPTKYRGTVLIHAGLAPNREACLEEGFNPADLKRGGIVGIAEIADCVTSHRSKWFEGKYGFVLRNRRPIKFIAWRGGLGLRKVTPKLLRLA